MQYHKVVALNKFLDDYQRNIKSSNVSMLQKKISKHYTLLKAHMEKFKQNLLHQVSNFEKAI